MEVTSRVMLPELRIVSVFSRTDLVWTSPKSIVVGATLMTPAWMVVIVVNWAILLLSPAEDAVTVTG